MRLSGEWMAGIDDRILEFLDEEEEFSTPKKMFETGKIRGVTRSYINIRCKKLTDYGLLQNVGNGVYQITEAGEEYLAGELDTANLDPNQTASQNRSAAA